MKLYGFANFAEQHPVPYEYVSISLVVMEASMRLLQKGFYCMAVINNLHYSYVHSYIASIAQASSSFKFLDTGILHLPL